MRREESYHPRGSDLGWEPLIRFAICITLFVWIRAGDTGVRLYQVRGTTWHTNTPNICPRIGHWESLGVRQEASQVGTWDKLILNRSLGIWSIIASEKTLSIDKAAHSRTLGAVHFRKSQCSIIEWRLPLPDNIAAGIVHLRLWHLYCLSWQRDTAWHLRDQVRRNIGLLSLSHKQWSLSS